MTRPTRQRVDPWTLDAFNSPLSAEEAALLNEEPAELPSEASAREVADAVADLEAASAQWAAGFERGRSPLDPSEAFDLAAIIAAAAKDGAADRHRPNSAHPSITKDENDEQPTQVLWGSAFCLPRAMHRLPKLRTSC